MSQRAQGRSENDPLAYFITFRCYGTWLPGDARGWTERPGQGWKLPLRSGHPSMLATAGGAMEHVVFLLEVPHRAIVREAIRDVCTHRGWTLHALNVRTNHIHLVVSAGSPPEHVMTALKAWSTRCLREAGFATDGTKVWSRHGSTKYLWRSDEIEAACRYVLAEQGADLP